MKILVWVRIDDLESIKQGYYSNIVFWIREPHDNYSAVQIMIDYDMFVKFSDT